MSIVIANAKVSAGRDDQTRDVHVLIEGDCIADVLPASRPPPKATERIDASGLLLLPGGIDPHVHFNTPGYTEHEDFTSGSMSAAAGGVTCVVDMPDTSVPPVADRAGLYAKLKAIGEMSVIDFALWGGVSGNSFRTGAWRSQMKTLGHEGVVGIKCYMLSGMATFEHLMPLELLEVMRRASEIGLLVALHAEDREMAHKLTATLTTQGRRDARAYYESRKDPVEASGMAQGAQLAAETGCSLHIVHVGSAAGARAATQFRGDGHDITMETCPHYLAFSHEDMERVGSILKTSPVIKNKEDSKFLWSGLADGSIDYIASDHAPCRPDEKSTGSIWTDYAGISGTQLLLPYLISEGYLAGRITLARLVRASSTAAAERLGLRGRKGSIERGMDADLVLVDPKAGWTVKGSDLLSKGKLTPFEGRAFKGRIVRTICRGTTVYEDGKGISVSPGFGHFVRRSS